MGERSGRIAVSGATGFIGTHLSRYLTERGYTVTPLDEALFRTEDREGLAEAVEGCTAVVNLAGAPILHRWTRRYREELYTSRVRVTRMLVDTINAARRKPKTLISASAVGYYPARGCYDEYKGVNGSGFLARLCANWERAARNLTPEVRLVIMRLGTVLAPSGGAFEHLSRGARHGMATVLGSGDQPISWIAVEDAVRAIGFLLEVETLRDVVNCTAPQQLDALTFARIVARHYRSRMTIRIPALLLRIAYGRAADVLTDGQCAIPAKLAEAGFAYHARTLQRFLERLHDDPLRAR